MDSQGIDIACLGDSTTWGADGHDGGGPDISWTAHLGEFLNVSQVRNFGVKGSRIGMKEDRSDSFIERWESLDLNADIICVFGGVNDFGRAVPLGEMGQNDPFTFYGALNLLARGLISRYPKAAIVFMTPCKSGGIPEKGLPAFNVPNAVGKTEDSYAEAMLSVCGFYSIPTIDLYRSSSISPLIPQHRQLYMPDGLHYSSAGYKRLAQRIAAGLSSVVL